MSASVLCLNAGSSSLKFALFETRGAAAPLARLHGQVEGIGAAPHFVVRDARGEVLEERAWPAAAGAQHEDFLGELIGWVEAHLGGSGLTAVGHRIVHGGAEFLGPVRIDEAVLQRLARLEPLAPLHQPHNLAAVRAVAAIRPDLVQVACFDTAFHRTQPAAATRLALPRSYADQGVRRYGFHGLSYEYIARRLRERRPELARGRVLAAHLGAGASLCAMRGGASLDTTMGFTALDGLVMGTRCGALDPGVVLFLLQALGMTAEAVSDLLYRRSGLLGVSGLSADFRELLASDTVAAAEAIELFVYRLVREAGALTAVLGGLDGLVFTGGVGEHAAPIRAAACERLAWLGVRLDSAANAAGAEVISAPDSAVQLLVVPTDEEAMIAEHVIETLRADALAAAEA